MHIVSPSANLNAYFSLIVKNTKQSNPDDSLLKSRLLPLVSYFLSILLNVLMMKNVLDKILPTQGVKLKQDLFPLKVKITIFVIIILWAASTF